MKYVKDAGCRKPLLVHVIACFFAMLKVLCANRVSITDRYSLAARSPLSFTWKAALGRKDDRRDCSQRTFHTAATARARKQDQGIWKGTTSRTSAGRRDYSKGRTRGAGHRQKSSLAIGKSPPCRSHGARLLSTHRSDTLHFRAHAAGSLSSDKHWPAVRCSKDWYIQMLRAMRTRALLRRALELHGCTNAAGAFVQQHRSIPREHREHGERHRACSVRLSAFDAIEPFLSAYSTLLLPACPLIIPEAEHPPSTAIRLACATISRTVINHDRLLDTLSTFMRPPPLPAAMY